MRAPLQTSSALKNLRRSGNAATRRAMGALMSRNVDTSSGSSISIIERIVHCIAREATTRKRASCRFRRTP
jgi:hypothetical protein